MFYLFENYYSPENIAKTLVPQTAFAPYPKSGEPNTLTEAQKKTMIAAGEEYLGYGHNCKSLSSLPSSGSFY